MWVIREGQRQNGRIIQQNTMEFRRNSYFDNKKPKPPKRKVKRKKS